MEEGSLRGIDKMNSKIRKALRLLTLTLPSHVASLVLHCWTSNFLDSCVCSGPRSVEQVQHPKSDTGEPDGFGADGLNTRSARPAWATAGKPSGKPAGKHQGFFMSSCAQIRASGI